jgi:hypothetical protein
VTSRSLRWATIAVWTVWALMFAVALGSIALAGRNIPFAEDWGLVAPLTGHEPDVFAWLWAQNNEHRVPVPRLVGLTLVTLTRDYRAGMVLNACVLAGVAAAMMLVARRLRGGRTSYADAFFPLMFLHLGHWDNIVWSWQMQFVLATAATCVLLLMIAVHGRGDLGTRASIVTGLALMALPLTGATSLVFAPPLALWVALAGARSLRGTVSASADRRNGAILLGSVVFAILLMAFYFVGWQRPPWNPPSPGTHAALGYAARFVAFGLGPGAGLSWRVSELVACVVLVATGAVLLAALARCDRFERLRLIGLLLFVAGAVVLSLAIGSGRAAKGGMSTRYALLGVPMFCLAYLAWEIYGPPALRKPARAGFLLIAILVLPFNTRVGMERRNWFGRGFQALEHDLGANVPPAVLAARHHAFLQQNEAVLATKIRMLHQARFGPFARLGDDASGQGADRTW